MLPYIGKTPLCHINNAALAGFREARQKEVAASTVNKELTLVVTIMNVACDIWEWIDYVPRIKQVKGPEKQPYPLKWDEQDKLFAHLPEWWAQGPALFAINTGMRAGEMFGLKWEHVQEFMDGMVATVEGKNGLERAVVCNSLAKLAVERQEGNDSRYIFASRSSRNMGGRIVSWKKPIAKAWELARLPDGPLVRRGIHNFRHTCGYRHRLAGTPEEDRRLILGHENANLMQHYAQPNLERLMEYAEKITVRPEKPEFILRSVRSVG